MIPTELIAPLTGYLNLSTNNIYKIVVIRCLQKDNRISEIYETAWYGIVFTCIYQQTNCESQGLLIIWTKKHNLKNKMRSKQAAWHCVYIAGSISFPVSIERHTDRVL